MAASALIAEASMVTPRAPRIKSSYVVIISLPAKLRVESSLGAHAFVLLAVSVIGASSTKYREYLRARKPYMRVGLSAKPKAIVMSRGNAWPSGIGVGWHREKQSKRLTLRKLRMTRGEAAAGTSA